MVGRKALGLGAVGGRGHGEAYGWELKQGRGGHPLRAQMEAAIPEAFNASEKQNGPNSARVPNPKREPGAKESWRPNAKSEPPLGVNFVRSRATTNTGLPSWRK